jgi:hypothetical protein
MSSMGVGGNTESTGYVVGGMPADPTVVTTTEWTITGLNLAAGAGGGAGAVATARGAATFFKGASYTDKVIKQMSAADDLYHAFPTAVDRLAVEAGRVTTIVGRDGATYLRLQADGMVNGVKGVFEYIKNAAGQINHRLFVPTKP